MFGLTMVFSLFLFIPATPVGAQQTAPVGLVQKTRGSVSFEGKIVRPGDVLKRGGILKTGTKSFVKLVVKKWNGQIVLGPNAHMKLDWKAPEMSGKYGLLSGACRWQSLSGKKAKGGVSGRVAGFGVRGTDFFIKSNALLNETEVVVLDGMVEMTNFSDSSDKAIIKKGQWGGLGGRYGQKIGQILDLPDKVTDHYRRMLKL